MTRPIYAYSKGPPRAKRQNPEAALQVTVKQFLTWALPAEVEWTSSLAGVFLGIEAASKMKAQGLRPGWPDLQFLIGRRTFYIEMKKPIAVASRHPERYGTLDDPDLSADQRRVIGAMHPGSWAICRSVDDVARALTGWGVQLRADPWAPVP